MNLLMFNLAVDAEHVTLSFGLKWIERLAKAFDRIDIVTMYEGRHSLPANVHVYSAGREKGYPLLWRIARFYAHTAKILVRHKPALAFAHMIPEFALLFAPLSWLTRTPSILWYAHGHVPRNLKLAHKVVDHVVSSTPEGFRLPSTKVTFIGQGIDAELYRFQPRQPDGTLRMISVGRLAPSKGQDLIIRALARWQPPENTPWRMIFVGGPTDDNEQRFAREIESLAQTLLPSGSSNFTGRLDAKDITPLLAKADLSISLGTTGSLDKTIVEAMASGCPVISCNDAFRAIAQKEGFSECVIKPEENDLNRAVSWFASMDAEERLEIARKQSMIAHRDHTLDGLILRLVSLLNSFAPKTKP